MRTRSIERTTSTPGWPEPTYQIRETAYRCAVVRLDDDEPTPPVGLLAASRPTPPQDRAMRRLEAMRAAPPFPPGSAATAHRPPRDDPRAGTTLTRRGWSASLNRPIHREEAKPTGRRASEPEQQRATAGAGASSDVKRPAADVSSSR